MKRDRKPYARYLQRALLHRIRNSLGRLLAEVAKKISVDPRGEEPESAKSAMSFEDQPITSPGEDRFGFDPLATALADSISKMESPHGTAIAVNGPWGSGKSSVVNLVKHYLRNGMKTGDLEIVDFKCWWFRGEEALTLAFFQELYAAMKPNVGKKAKKVIAKLGSQQLIKASPVVGSVLNVAAPGTGSIASAAMKAVGDFISQDKTVEKLHGELSEELSKGLKRYLIVIDDIDRLSPDEALLIFRLVKSVGALPKVFYLLAYDRHLAEKLVTERYPSEGPHYLEKIIQASFDLPEPLSLDKEFLRHLYRIIEEQEFEDKRYFDRLFERLIAPEIKTPRDLLRILNPLQVTWAAVKGEVDPTDFLCLETLRIQRPGLYGALRRNKSRLTVGAGRGPDSPEEYDKIFLESEPESERESLRSELKRLFPLLQSGWGGSGLGMSNSLEMDKHRRACSPKHFDTYFRFALSDEVLRMGEIKELIDHSGDPEFVRQAFRQAAKIKRPTGDTRAALLLEALRIHAEDVPERHIGSLLKAVYSIADDLVGQQERGLDAGVDGTTMADLLWLRKALTLRCASLEDKSAVLLEACQGANLGCLVFIAQSAYGEHYSSGNALPSTPGNTLMTREHTNKLKELAVKHIRKATADGSLINCPLLDGVLLWWGDMTGSDEAARSWVSETIKEHDHAVARLARAFTGVSKAIVSNGEGVVARTEMMRRVVDLDEFRTCVERALEGGCLELEDCEALQAFQDAWQRGVAIANGQKTSNVP